MELKTVPGENADVRNRIFDLLKVSIINNLTIFL